MPRSLVKMLRALGFGLNATDGEESQTGPMQVERNLTEGVEDEASGVEQAAVHRGPSGQEHNRREDEQGDAGHPHDQAAN
jgi:hypothetical protein